MPGYLALGHLQSSLPGHVLITICLILYQWSL